MIYPDIHEYLCVLTTQPVNRSCSYEMIFLSPIYFFSSRHERMTKNQYLREDEVLTSLPPKSPSQSQ